jgi:hypothetical protein
MKLASGIYTPADAAALLHERPRTVRRWAFGATRPPLIRTELPALEGERAVTFLELVELLYVRTLRRAGVSPGGVREASSVAARLYECAHPFALRRVYLDPAHVLYAAVADPDGTASLVQLRGHGQQEIPPLVRPFLTQLDFGVDDLARRWWPMGHARGIALDPALSFGAPVVEEVGIRASVLADAYDAERAAFGDRAIARVAWSYEIEPRHVDAALEFRRWLRAA